MKRNIQNVYKPLQKVYQDFAKHLKRLLRAIKYVYSESASPRELNEP